MPHAYFKLHHERPGSWRVWMSWSPGQGWNSSQASQVTSPHTKGKCGLWSCEKSPYQPWAEWMLSNKPVQAPLKSITLEYRHEKARLVMELRNFSDEIVKDMHARVATGKDWRIRHCGGWGPKKADRHWMGWSQVPVHSLQRQGGHCFRVDKDSAGRYWASEV